MELARGLAEEIKRVRIEHGKSLLVRTDRNIAEIAFLCGFGDHARFFRRFREQTGTSPAAYRAQKRRESR